jgi:hypothetical protein
MINRLSDVSVGKFPPLKIVSRNRIGIIDIMEENIYVGDFILGDSVNFIQYY